MFKLVGQKESFPVKILVDFYFYGIAEYECDKKNCSFTHQFLGEDFNSKTTFVIITNYTVFNYCIQLQFIKNVSISGFLITKYFVSKNSVHPLLPFILQCCFL
jgi:hypothetical protein